MKMSRSSRMGRDVALALLTLPSPSSAQQQRGACGSAGCRAAGACRSGAGPQRRRQAPMPSAAAPSDGPRPPTRRHARRKPLAEPTLRCRDMSPWSMFMSADVLVKAVMIGLAFASLVTWTILIAKMIELSLAQRRLRDGARHDRRSAVARRGADRARRQGSVLASLLAAAMREARLSAGHFQRRRHQGARGLELRRNRARRSAPASGSAWACSPPSARPRRSSGCSAPSGAS